MTLDIVFVCQHGELEVMACLLAASLRHHCGDDVCLHAIEPMPAMEYGVVSPLARRFLNDLGVNWYSFKNPISDDYKIFNKLNAFSIRPESERIFFLDSDTFARKPFLQSLQPYFNRPFAAKSAGKQRFLNWAPVYRRFDLPVPKMRWPGSADHQWGPPYFNAGAILADASLDFSTHWIDTCLQIHLDEDIEMENRGTVQVGLPVVLYRRNIPYALLDKRFNFALSRAWLKSRHPWSDEEAHIVHYFKPENLTVDPVIHHEVGELIRRFELHEILSLRENWEKLLWSYETSALDRGPVSVPRHHASLHRLSDSTPEIASAPAMVAVKQDETNVSPKRMALVTGIPHSGAEEFAEMLTGIPGITILDDSMLPAELKLCGTFGQHNLSLLPQILTAFPEMTCFVLVRHPITTIAAWKTLPDFGDAGRIDEQIAMETKDPRLSETRRRHLMPLREVEDPAMKLAGLWDYFSVLANVHNERVHIFCFEDLVSNPAALLRHTYDVLFQESNFNHPNSAVTEQKDYALAQLREWDKECIRVICSNNAGVFGYNLYEV